MEEQLRAEAEKRNLVYAKNINNEYNITGLIDISKNPPKIYCFCTEEIAKEILDFHAQQSKERDSELIGFVEWADLNATQTSKGYWYGSAIKIEPKKAVKTAELFIIYKSTLTK